MLRPLVFRASSPNRRHRFEWEDYARATLIAVAGYWKPAPAYSPIGPLALSCGWRGSDAEQGVCERARDALVITKEYFPDVFSTLIGAMKNDAKLRQVGQGAFIHFCDRTVQLIERPSYAAQIGCLVLLVLIAGSAFAIVKFVF